MATAASSVELLVEEYTTLVHELGPIAAVGSPID